MTASNARFRDPYSPDDPPCPSGGANKGLVTEVIHLHARKPRRDTAIEPGRLLRAPMLVSEKLGVGQYKIASASRPGRFYYIDLNSDQPCDCEDSEFGGGRMCMHFLHARLREGDEMVLLALGQILLRNQRVLAQFLGDESTEEE